MDEGRLYRMVGERIRAARERLQPRMSQARLAKTLGMSRVSIVNIEAGRQHPPLHLLWRIAEVLHTEVPHFIPKPDEYNKAGEPIELSEETIARLIEEAQVDPKSKRLLSDFINKALTRSEGLE